MTTLKDIAAAAKVSVTTVSDVLNGKSEQRRVSAACTKRVLAIAKELNYKPHINARGLAKQQTFLIGVLAYSMHSSFWGEFLQGLITHLEAKDYRVIVSHSPDQRSANKATEEMLARKVDGIICAGPVRPAKKYWDDRWVFSHGPTDNKKMTWISVDDECGMRQSIEHLHQGQHQHIGLYGDINQRASFAKQFCKERKMSCLHAELDALVKAVHNNNITAVSCCSDRDAIQLMSALQNNGLKVPDDCAVIGYDDIEACQWMSPTLTTIRQPQQSYGQLLAETLLKKIDGEKAVSQLLEPKLIVREST